MKSIKNLISLGYLLMALLVIGIMYIWYKEWCDLEKLEVQNRHIDTFRQESHEIFVLLIELSLSGETVLEWNMQIWNITIINAWQWTVCYAVSKRFIRQSA